MNNEYTEFVSYKTAKLLNNNCFPEHTYFFYYALGDVEISFNNYLSVVKHKDGDFIYEGDYIHGPHCVAPLYCDVIDWLKSYFNIIIELIPAFTFALNDNVAYYYKVYKINKFDGKLDTLFEENMEMSSFKLAIDTIIEKLITENYIKLNKNEIK